MFNTFRVLRFFTFNMLLLAFAVMCGCETTDSVSVKLEDFNQLSPGAGLKESVTLAAGDVLLLSVEVDGRMEYTSHRAVVNLTGFVSLPLVGDVAVNGLTLEQARHKIIGRYSKYYVSPPLVMLSVSSVGGTSEWGSVSVLGQVGSPGSVSLSSGAGIRLSEAIQQAGGFSSSAKKSAVRVTRNAETGEKKHVVIDYNEIGQQGNADADLMLIDGDIIYVPQRVW